MRPAWEQRRNLHRQGILLSGTQGEGKGHQLLGAAFPLLMQPTDSNQAHGHQMPGPGGSNEQPWPTSCLDRKEILMITHTYDPPTQAQINEMMECPHKEARKLQKRIHQVKRPQVRTMPVLQGRTSCYVATTEWPQWHVVDRR